jgi:hypothetical protein
MYNVKIIRRIYDGSSFDDSINYASTIREMSLPIPPFIGMIVLMPCSEEIDKIMVNADTQEISCFLSDYYANQYPNDWDFQEKIDNDISNGMKLIFSKPIP